MSKIYEKLLADYKKANKDYKKKLLEKFGFKTEEEFYEVVGYKPSTNIDDVTPVDYVIAFDTTGSMSAYIENVKQHVRELIPTLFKDTPNLRMQIIAFGDYCDMPTKDNFGNAYQTSHFTDNQNKLIDFVNNAKNTSGGDSDEFYELVIKKITEDTPWRTGSKRNVLFIGDCNPHLVGYSYKPIITSNQIDWKIEAKKAFDLGIQFDTISILGYKFYEELAKLTGGVCTPFVQAKKINKIIEAVSAVRYNKEKFRTMNLSATTDGDVELMGAYKSMSTLL